MRLSFALLGVGLLSAALPGSAAASPEDSVVKVYASSRFPNPTKPWTKGDAQESRGSGVVIEGKRILTNAHVVSYATEVYVQSKQGGEKERAVVVALNPDVDLAVLALASKDDDTFWTAHPPLLRAKASQLPGVQDAVVTYGFPVGGDALSVTKGVVSRIDFAPYGNRGVGVVIQVSNAINPGNSGGPAVVDDKMVGLVVSRVRNAQNIGSVIPNEEIELFLDDLKDGRYDGKPIDDASIVFQNFDNDALRRMLKVGPKVKGVLVQLPAHLDAKFPLKPLDIVTHVAGQPIDNNGMVKLKNGLLAPFNYLIPREAKNGAVPLTVWRDGKATPVAYPVSVLDKRLVPPYQGEPLSYFVHGPLVFAPARSNDQSLYAAMNRTFYFDNSPQVTRGNDLARFPGEELVVVSAPMFRHEVSKGYADPVGKTVKDVNGVAIKNLRHLVETIRDSKDEFLTFRFVDEYSSLLVFDRKAMEAATEEIMEDHGIAANRRASSDLLKLWRTEAKKSAD